MNIDGFWDIIEECRQQTVDCKELTEVLVSRLCALSGPEIAQFASAMDETMDRAYRWDLWGAAYIINAGCSDDGFEYFRGWLISRGREAFERALRDPEELASFAVEGECEDILYAPLRAYQKVTGSEALPPRHVPYPDQPSGDSWDEDDLDERFPRLTAAFG